ncbi:MAG: hypothetical protein KDD60_03095 [Bdellovibrionales bacterium]|nr:hypothetical protein [Bdellovibrionales bacterium]
MTNCYNCRMHERTKTSPPALEKAGLRESIESIIANGGTDEALRKFRQQIAEECNVSVRSLAAITAYPRYSATQALRSTGIDEDVGPDQLIEAAYFVKSSPDSERREIILCYAESYGVSFDALSRAIDSYRSLIDSKPNGKVTTIPPPIVLSEDSFAERAHWTSPSRGDSDIYDTETKRKWRAAWGEEVQAFVAKLSHVQRQKLKVLCLPSRTPEPEIEIYLNSGISPENIYAIEGGSSDARQEFAARLSADSKFRGVVGVCHRLEEWLPTCGQTFDVVSLDFHGYLSFTNQKILNHLCLADSALVMVNSLARRESSPVSTFLTRSAANYLDQNLFVQYLGAVTLGKEKMATVAKEKLDGLVSLPEARRAAIDLIMLEAIGTAADRSPWKSALGEFRDYIDEYHLPHDRSMQGFDTSPPFYVQSSLVILAGRVLKGYMASILAAYVRDQEADLTEFGGMLTVVMPSLFVYGLFETPRIRAMKLWEYRSDSGAGSSKFHTTIGTMFQPKGLYNSYRSTMRFMTEFMLSVFRALRNSNSGKSALFPEIKVFDRHLLHELPSGSPYNDRNKICLMRGGSKPICSINAGAYMSQLRRFAHEIDEYHASIQANTYPKDGRRVIG